MIRPFFTFYGGKWRAVPKYPSPQYPTIVEPFAGSAGYAVRYADRQVILCDTDPKITRVWSYLIHVSPEELLNLPDLPDHVHVDTLPVCQEAKWLIGYWLNKGSAQPRNFPSAWMRSRVRPGSYWGERVRKVLAAQVPLIRHWKVYECSYEQCPYEGPATWFLDPPYQHAGKHYQHGSKFIDYEGLGQWARARQGQVIVCENEGATWLPFEPLGATKATPGRFREGYSKEVIATWLNSKCGSWSGD